MHNLFPNLIPGEYTYTSPPTIDYNCIAWAAGDTEAWWWPDPFYQYFWPAGIPREETINAFIRAFESLGYLHCEDGNHENGFEKIAIYAKPDGRPTHAARQIAEQMWTSKIGKLEDIEHRINSLSGPTYGTPVVFMKRPA
jgi:hypothetical protein